jgi:PPOX class probable F420-dependent enzyme
MPLTDREIEDFLGQPNIAVMATVGADGQPHAVPTWYDYDGGEIVLHMGAGSRRYRNMTGNDRVAVCVDTKTPPYMAVVVEGRARTKVGTDDERSRRMAIHYLGEKAGAAYADSLRGSRMVIARVVPEKIISWDYGRGDNP